MTQGMTTLKVRMSTRDMITKAARAHGQTVDAFLSALLEEQAWRDEVSAARAVMAHPDDGYLEETAVWDSLALPDSS